MPEPEVGTSQLSATVLAVDRFGNVALNMRREHLDAIGLPTATASRCGSSLDRYYAIVAGTFADAAPGELILYEDSYGLATLAISQGSAARLTGVAVGRRAADRARVTLGQRFARLVTTSSFATPCSGASFRRPLTRNFDRLAPTWDTLRVTERYLSPLAAALEAVEPAPARALDVGTGTGRRRALAAGRWPDAEIVGVDLSAGMIAEARDARPRTASATTSPTHRRSRSPTGASTSSRSST